MQRHNKHYHERCSASDILKQCGLRIANGRFDLGHHTLSPLLCRATALSVSTLFSLFCRRVKNFLGTFENKFENILAEIVNLLKSNGLLHPGGAAKAEHEPLSRVGFPKWDRVATTHGHLSEQRPLGPLAALDLPP